MAPSDESDDVTTHHVADSLTDEQLAAFEHGWAAIIMPASEGWKIRYVSTPSFDDEPGTTFGSLDEALAAIHEVLPAVNTPQEKARARHDLERRHPAER